MEQIKRYQCEILHEDKVQLVLGVPIIEVEDEKKIISILKITFDKSSHEFTYEGVKYSSLYNLFDLRERQTNPKTIITRDFAYLNNDSRHWHRFPQIEEVALKARMLYSYEAEDEGELTVNENDIVYILGEAGNGWLVAKRADGEKGYVPENFVEFSANTESE